MSKDECTPNLVLVAPDIKVGEWLCIIVNRQSRSQNSRATTTVSTFKDHKTQADLRDFLNGVKKDHAEIMRESEEIKEKIGRHRPQDQLDDFVLKFIEMQAQCSAPQWVMWMSKDRRDACKKAKHDLYMSSKQLVNNIDDNADGSSAIQLLERRAKYLDSMVKKNRQFV